ncbi:hypothetical protein J4573_07425 [Actinomadura barringtoniae]|uniref:Uncharacterized protein n=1 Tax=Actinomadura barringtoniae TaxID=1427535 RepID=A0A939T167_9ACTN|nr:hypothetical protein [Actinomadura barringtoniae]MBO2446916.1 hypothetical protein [Actinomadura barringtoniae]
MDPITASALTAVLLKVGEGATGEAGKQLWEKFTGLVKTAFGRTAPEVSAAQELQTGNADQTQVESLAQAVVAMSERDPELAQGLRAWIAEAEQPASTGNVTNTISGNAKVTGSVIQGRDFHGNINLGN